MKKTVFILLCVCLFVGTTACSNGDDSLVKASISDDNAIVFNANTPVGGMGASCSMNIVSVNGEHKTFEDPIFYSGENVRFDIVYTVGSESIDFNTLFLCFLDGVLIPFNVNDNADAQTTYVKGFKAGDIQSLAFIPSLRDKAIQNPSRLRFVAAGNFDARADAMVNTGPPALLTMYSFDIYLAEGYQPTDAEFPSAVLSGVENAGGHFETRETFFPKMWDIDGEISPYSRVYAAGRFDNTANYTDFVVGRDQLRLLASVPPGKYRTVIFRDDEPVPAFDGNLYWDWESPAEGTQVVADIPLDQGILPKEGVCNIYPIHIAMDDFPDGTTSMISMDSICTSFIICTVEVLSP
jgi:hypothetical protein